MKAEQKNQHDKIKQTFKEQASGWQRPSQVVDSYTAKALSMLELQANDLVLDVACGSGLLSMVIAPEVDSVVATDITIEMLQVAQGRHIDNLLCVQATAENLPYPDASFDCVVTRYALHHMFDPANVLNEMIRVCRPGGQLMVMDLIAPDTPEEFDLYNTLERRRDPSHTTALRLETLKQFFADLKDVNHSVEQLPERDIKDWFDLAHTPDDVREDIHDIFQQELAGQITTGFNPVERDGKIMFVHTIGIIIGTKND